MSQLTPVNWVFENNDVLPDLYPDALEYKIFKGEKLVYSTKLFNRNGCVVLDENTKLPSLDVGKYTVVVNSFYHSSQIKTTTLTITKAKTTLKAPNVINKYKKSQYFKVNIKLKGKPVKNIKINLKIYTGKKYKNYIVKTDNNGIAKFNTKNLKIGKHKVIITSKNNNYAINGKSQITIKR